MMWLDRLLKAFRRHANVEASPEAQRAERRAAEGLRNEIQRGPEVARVTESLRQAVIRNHFSEAMEHLIVVRSNPGERR